MCLDKLEKDKHFAGAVALHTQMLLAVGEKGQQGDAYESELYLETARIIAQAQREGTGVPGNPLKLADYYWGVVYLYALKKLFTTRYETIAPQDLARTVVAWIKWNGKRREKKYGPSALTCLNPAMALCFLVQLRGAVQPGALLGPVRAVFAAHESTLCRIELCADGRAFYRRQTQTGCTVQLAQGDWQSLLRQQERRPFDLQNGELMRVFALTSPQGKTQLLLMAHHLVGDGKAIVGFIEEVLRALAGTPPVFCPLWVLNGQTMPKATGLPAPAVWYAAHCNRHWQRKGPHV